MCGIAGFLDLSRSTHPDRLRGSVSAMAGTLRHRGPDDAGVWVDGAGGIALGHRRLAVVDLSPAGRQPMASRSGNLVLVYNGEIYNADPLRVELERCGRSFRGRSDSEVLVEACDEWGVERTVGRLIGMFAFALWDRRSQSLTLVRDRLGIKPLYWGRFGALFLFGSELKALTAHGGWDPAIDRESLADYMLHKYVPQPRSIYKDVFKLMPGHLLEVGPGDAPRTICYWDLRSIAAGATGARLALTRIEAAERLEALLLDAVGRRMVSDVPLGAFLSGGIDSSAVVALMQARSPRPVRTFTVGFDDPRFDEAPRAAAVAGHLGTDHTELAVGPRDALDIIPDLAAWYDEPFADSSQIPSALISRLTRRHVTVVLTGDGGDEVFGGYNRYARACAIRRALGWAGALLGRRTAGPRPPIATARGPRHKAGLLFGKAAAVVSSAGEMELYRHLVTNFDGLVPPPLTGPCSARGGVFWDDSVAADIPDYMERMMFLDTVTYLPDDVLTKVDRATMAVGLEARVPLLDHRVVEFVWRLPPSVKFDREESKSLLRSVLRKYVPEQLTDRRKAGFRVPIRSWLRGPLKEWAGDLLCDRRLREEGFFDVPAVLSMWSDHRTGRNDWDRVLWRVLMFQAWVSRQRDRQAPVLC